SIGFIHRAEYRSQVATDQSAPITQVSLYDFLAGFMFQEMLQEHQRRSQIKNLRIYPTSFRPRRSHHQRYTKASPDGTVNGSIRIFGPDFFLCHGHIFILGVNAFGYGTTLWPAA